MEDFWIANKVNQIRESTNATFVEFAMQTFKNQAIAKLYKGLT